MIYDKMVQGATGALFFINPTKVQEPTRLDMVESVAEDFDANPPVDAASQSTDPVPLGIGWVPRLR